MSHRVKGEEQATNGIPHNLKQQDGKMKLWSCHLIVVSRCGDAVLAAKVGVPHSMERALLVRSLVSVTTKEVTLRLHATRQTQ